MIKNYVYTKQEKLEQSYFTYLSAENEYRAYVGRILCKVGNDSYLGLFNTVEVDKDANEKVINFEIIPLSSNEIENVLIPVKDYIENARQSILVETDDSGKVIGKCDLFLDPKCRIGLKAKNITQISYFYDNDIVRVSERSKNLNSDVNEKLVLKFLDDAELYNDIKMHNLIMLNHISAKHALYQKDARLYFMSPITKTYVLNILNDLQYGEPDVVEKHVNTLILRFLTEKQFFNDAKKYCEEKHNFHIPATFENKESISNLTLNQKRVLCIASTEFALDVYEKEQSSMEDISEEENKNLLEMIEDELNKATKILKVLQFNLGIIKSTQDSIITKTTEEIEREDLEKEEEYVN